MTDHPLTIIIPCFNEADRLPKQAFINFLGSNRDATICFVNDASSDGTQKVLERFKVEFPERVKILSNKTNKGKAESIRFAVNHCLSNDSSPYFAYLDADLATSLEECASYLKYLGDGKKFVFASRILKIGSVVERKFSRFFFGRIIATIISTILGIKVYDTQCGCKVFSEEIAKVAFETPFISKWLFDVELFSRQLHHYGKEKALEQMEEIPVKRWVDQGESKVKMSYFFKLWADLYLIWRIHNKK